MEYLNQHQKYYGILESILIVIECSYVLSNNYCMYGKWRNASPVIAKED